MSEPGDSAKNEPLPDGPVRNEYVHAEVPHLSDAGRTTLQKVFLGPRGLHAGWRVLIFLAISVALFAGEGLILRLLIHQRPPKISFTAMTLLVAEGGSFAVILIASAIMGAFEKRTLGHYGLPVGHAFGAEFWRGAALGFAAITALLGTMRAAGVFHFGGVALHGTELVKYAFLWTCVFLLVGFFEEFGFRGYLLYTMTDGLGFWPAAIVLSTIFGYVHHNNSGETWLGAFSAGEIGFVFCLMLRGTGSLWMPIGFHAAWDWGETFFYGVPDSGQVAAGHFFDSTLSGPAWLTGGTVGPEASWLCIGLVLAIGVLIVIWLPTAKYPAKTVREGSELAGGETASSG